jgi:hypothetical protein
MRQRLPRILLNAARAFALLIIGVQFALGCKKPTPAASSSPPNRPSSTTVAATKPVQVRSAPIPTGRFEYTGYYLGNPVITGTLEISSTQYDQVCGAWHLKAASAPPPTVTLGPQVGDGPLYLVEGINHETGFMTNRIPDYEVSMMVSQADQDSLSGTWAYADVSGVVSSGQFVARRVK